MTAIPRASRMLDRALAVIGERQPVGGQSCRWCGAPSIRWTPCGCDRAQEEARRIRADHR